MARALERSPFRLLLDGRSAPRTMINNPSLSIREADGKVLLHCHAGCTQGDVIDALKAQGSGGRSRPRTRESSPIRLHRRTRKSACIRSCATSKGLKQRRPDGEINIEKGESLKDTGLTLRALGAEAIILRHNSSGAAWLLEEATRLPVINAGDGMHEHPTQALLDLRTILTHLRPGVAGVAPDTLAGVTVMITGDILHSRVARSNMLLLPRVGARVLLCGPKELLPEQAARSGPGIEIERDFDAALAQSQVAMMLRIQAERLAGLQLDLDEYKANYQLTGQRLAAQAPNAIVLHPGPIIRGLEITAGVADGVQSAILEQVTNGVAIRMAVMKRALAVEGGRA